MEMFKMLLPFQSPEEMGKLSKEFTEFQILCDEHIPKQIWDKVTELTLIMINCTTGWISYYSVPQAFQDSDISASNSTFQCLRRVHFLHGL